MKRKLNPEQVIFDDGSVLQLNSMMNFCSGKKDVVEYVESITLHSQPGSQLTIIIKRENSVGYYATTAIIGSSDDTQKHPCSARWLNT